MGNRIAKLTNTGDLQLEGVISNRIPPVRSGLVAHFPFDGRIQGELWDAGWTATKTGTGAIQDYTHTNTCLQSGMTIKFSGWFRSTGINGQVTFYCYHQVNGTWSYQGSSINDSFKTGEWVYIERSFVISGAAGDTQSNWCQGISLRENCTTGTLEWKNCRCYIDAWATNCNVTDDGIYVEDAVTNLWNGLSTTGASGNWSVIDNPFPSCPFPRPLKVTRCTPRSNMNYYTISNSDGTSYPTGTVFTVSAWVFVDKNCDSMGPLFICGEGITNASSVYDKTKLGTWQYLKFTVTSTGAGFYFLLYANTGSGFSTWTKGNVYYANVQVEARSFASSYTPSTRGAGSLSIPCQLFNTNEGTVILDYYVSNANPGTYSRIFEIGAYANPYTRDWLSICRGTGWGSDHIDFYFEDVSTGAYNSCNVNGINALVGHWLKIAVSYSVSSKKGRFYVYDMTSHTSLYNSSFSMSTFDGFSTIYTSNAVLFGSNRQNTKLRNLSIYNRFLSDTDIDKLTKNKLSLSSSGDIQGIDICESPIGIPSDAYYYPLDFDTKDKNKRFSSSKSQNLIPDSGGLWVGTAVTNLVTQFNQAWGPWGTVTGATTSRVLANTNEINCKITVMGASSGTRYYDSNRITSTGGATYTASIIFKATNTPNTNLFYLRQYDSSGTQLSEGGIFANATKISLSDGWTIAYVTFTVSATCASFSLQGYEYIVNDITVRNLMCINKPFPTPYVSKSISMGALEFNFNSSIGLDWSKDWSMVYWKKPVGTHNDTMTTGYNIESLGSNGNSVGGGYVYWGRQNIAGDTFCVNSTSVGSLSNYFNKWHMVSLQKTGTTITIKVWTPSGVLIGTATTTNTVANYFVNQYGFDFKLGGWDTTYATNTLYKDLIVVPGRCMSDTEVTNLWKRKMSEKDMLYIQGSIKEKINL